MQKLQRNQTSLEVILPTGFPSLLLLASPPSLIGGLVDEFTVFFGTDACAFTFHLSLVECCSLCAFFVPLVPTGSDSGSGLLAGIPLHLTLVAMVRIKAS